MSADASGTAGVNDRTHQLDTAAPSDAAAPSASSPFQPAVELTSMAGLRMVVGDEGGLCGPDGCYTTVRTEATPAV